MVRRVIVIIVIVLSASTVYFWYSHRAEPSGTTATTTPRTSSICQKQTLQENMINADVILTAEVSAVLSNQDNLADVYVRPVTVYKGSIKTPTLRVAAKPTVPKIGSPADGRPTNELHFTSNDPPYLLFLHQRSDGRFDTSACAGSRLLGSGLTTDEQHIFESLDIQSS